MESIQNARPPGRHVYEHYFVKSMQDCIDLCLRNGSFDCVSVSYIITLDNRTCLLYNITRKMTPAGKFVHDSGTNYVGFKGGYMFH